MPCNSDAAQILHAKELLITEEAAREDHTREKRLSHNMCKSAKKEEEAVNRIRESFCLVLGTSL